MRGSRRFPTIVLAAGAIVLLVAIAIGERMGDRVIGEATQETLQSVIPVAVTPSPGAEMGPYGPDWKRSETLSVAGDPHFPDPRVPPQPLPTPQPTPKPKPTGPPTPTPNPNIPIWRQQPLPPPLSAPPEGATAVPSPGAGQSGPPSSSPP